MRVEFYFFPTLDLALEKGKCKIKGDEHEEKIT